MGVNPFSKSSPLRKGEGGMGVSPFSKSSPLRKGEGTSSYNSRNYLRFASIS